MMSAAEVGVLARMTQMPERSVRMLNPDSPPPFSVVESELLRSPLPTHHRKLCV